jgi:signal transduction histidine kinase
MNRGSLRLRLFLAGAISILAALALSAFGLSLLFERHVERRVVSELGVFLNRIVAGLDRNADGSLIVSDGLADPRFDQPLSGLYWQVWAGDAIVRSRSLWDNGLAAPEAMPEDGAVARFHLTGPDGSDLIAVGRYVTLPSRLGGDRIRAVVALDYAEIVAARQAFTADLLPYLVIIGLFLMIAAYAQIAVGLRPLAAVRNRLAAIRQGTSRRLGAEFPDEVLPLAAEVDALLEAREKQLEKARTRAGDLAHGLKTPLQVLAGDVERLRARGEEGIAKDIEQVTTSMRRHVDRELVRARTATGAVHPRAAIAEVIERVLDVVSRTPAGMRLDRSSDLPAGLAGRIDADDLAEAIGNLVENAARHARTTATVRANRENGRIFIRVIDDGPGIPPERLEQALARGGRLDQFGEGAGLGLAIVREIAEAWDGKLEINSSPAGLEAVFIVPDADHRVVPPHVN